MRVADLQMDILTHPGETYCNESGEEEGEKDMGTWGTMEKRNQIRSK